LDKIVDCFDFVEVLNSRNIYTKDNEKTLILSQKKGLAPVAGSDAHLSSELGRAYVKIDNFDTPM